MLKQNVDFLHVVGGVAYLVVELGVEFDDALILEGSVVLVWLVHRKRKDVLTD